MRIVYLHQYFNTPMMSGSTRSFEMAKRLVAAGHDVEMITSWREETADGQPFTTIEEGIRVHWLPVRYSNHFSYGQRIAAFFRFAFESGRLAASLPADVIFASSTPLTIAPPAVYAARRQRIPMVFEVRDLWPELPIAIGALRNPLVKWTARRLERFAYGNAAAIVALSDGMRDGVVATGYPADHVRVIPNISDLDRFKPDPVAGAAFRERQGLGGASLLMVYAGTFGKVNGVGWLARLAARFKGDPRIAFLAIGDGQEYAQVEQLARELGCLDVNFHMRGKVPKVEMPAVLAAADMSISTVIPLPELEANSANKFFDSLSAGSCTVINHGGWQAELLEASGAGFRLPFDIDAAAAELAARLSRPEAIVAARREARRIAEAHFSADRLASELEQFLSAVYQRELGRKG